VCSSDLKKRKFVADGVLYSEVNELLSRDLAESGYAGVEIRNAPMRTEVIIRASRPQDVLGEKGQRIRELTSAVQKRFNFAEGQVELYAERVVNRGLSAHAQAESLKYKLLGGLAVRRACYGIVKFVMESGAKGVEVVVAGKLRGQRAKAMKFRDGAWRARARARVRRADPARPRCARSLARQPRNGSGPSDRPACARPAPCPRRAQATWSRRATAPSSTRTTARATS
jgi:ribosomal protein uS3